MRYLFKQQGMMLINLLYAISGALTHKRYSHNFILSEYLCLRFGIAAAITFSILAVCLLREMTFVTTHLKQVWNLLPIASLVSFYPAFTDEAPVPNIMPFMPVTYSLAACWLCYPVVHMVLDKLDLPLRVLGLLAAPLLNITMIQLMPSQVLLDRRDLTSGLEYGTNLFYNHILFKLPIFITGVCAASIAEECSYKNPPTNANYLGVFTALGPPELPQETPGTPTTTDPIPSTFLPSEASAEDIMGNQPLSSDGVVPTRPGVPSWSLTVSSAIRHCVSSMGASNWLLGAVMDGLALLCLLVIMYDPTSSDTLYWFSNNGSRWTASYWTVLSSVLLLVPFSLWMIVALAYEEHSRASVSYRVLSSAPLIAVLEGRADIVYALSYKLILHGYTAHARGEFLKGKGFLLYCFIALMLCHTTAKYIWRPLELWWRVYVETNYGRLRGSAATDKAETRSDNKIGHNNIGYDQGHLAEERQQDISASVRAALHTSINWVPDDTDKSDEKTMVQIQSLSYRDGWEFFYKVFLAN
ncbi:putative transmembrane protein [Gregarina niphandrodes]|uniref:Transmembrane protein n=1 Tax=Gregarina niphandrodes TaxID=110365 RepID=A0A023B373_GRENI|nr:putative transmembrane protein [Gregarina niphandrodes]EZG55390.1 putative transmembrane protein [Gregarina niphandrodes]|eukprot:XP_011131590.1 putative transmembrane protein [Gregarina niphandrodes]